MTFPNCEVCGEHNERHIGECDVQESSTDKYLYRNKLICDNCVSDLMYDDYRIRSSNPEIRS